MNTQTGRSGGALAAGAVAALLASACCVGPLVLVLLGAGGAWVANLAALEPARPFFVGITLLFLALAFRRLYSAAAVCAPGERCALPVNRSRQRVVFWLVAIPLLALLAFPWYASIFY